MTFFNKKKIERQSGLNFETAFQTFWSKSLVAAQNYISAGI